MILSCINISDKFSFNNLKESDYHYGIENLPKVWLAFLGEGGRGVFAEWRTFTVCLRRQWRRFQSEQDAVNAVSDALFYVEKQVKDIKLAEPLGLKGGKCTQGEPACASAVENPLSPSGDNVSASMEAAINETLASLDAIDTSLQAAVTDANGVNLAKGAHESSKKITDRLKNDFLTVLGLGIPDSAAGDGD
jgi:hypothetical protein